MILEQLREQKDFTQAETEISRYVLSHLSDISQMTASDLGEASFTSKASVIRLCRKLSVSGYAEFIRTLEIERREQSRILQLLEDEPINGQTKMRELIDLVPSIYDKAISDTKKLLNPTLVQRVVNRIKQADHVDIYGVGIVEASIEASVFKLQSLGLSVSKQTNVNEHAVIANKSKKVLAILISFTGKNEMILAAANYLKENGVYLVGIGGANHTNLQELSDIFIETYAEGLIPSMEVLAPTVAINYILDLIYSGLVIADYDNQVTYAKEVIAGSRY